MAYQVPGNNGILCPDCDHMADNPELIRDHMTDQHRDNVLTTRETRERLYQERIKLHLTNNPPRTPTGWMLKFLAVFINISFYSGNRKRRARNEESISPRERSPRERSPRERSPERVHRNPIQNLESRTTDDPENESDETDDDSSRQGEESAADKSASIASLKRELEKEIENSKEWKNKFNRLKELSSAMIRNKDLTINNLELQLKHARDELHGEPNRPQLLELDIVMNTDDRDSNEPIASTSAAADARDTIISEPAQRNSKRKRIERSTACLLCEYSGKTNLELAVHMKSKHKMRQSLFQKCTDCNHIFNNEETLNDHISELHGETARVMETPASNVIIFKQREKRITSSAQKNNRLVQIQQRIKEGSDVNLRIDPSIGDKGAGIRVSSS